MTFKTNKFSVFALGYKDETLPPVIPVTPPSTSDNSSSSIIEDNKVSTVKKPIIILEDKKDEWEIKEQDGIFYVTGRAVQRLMGRVNIEDNESMYYLQKCLKNMGIEAKLKEMGVCEGDTVILDDWELEWYE